MEANSTPCAPGLDADLLTFMQRAVSVVLMTQLFGRERREAERFGGAIDRSIGSGMRMYWQQELFPLVSQTIFSLGLAAVIA